MDKYKVEVSHIADNHGALDILTAYLMRSRKMSYEKASDMVCDLDIVIDHMLDNLEEDEEEMEFDEEYTSSTDGDYSPSNPWNAPGMSASDFI